MIRIGDHPDNMTAGEVMRYLRIMQDKYEDIKNGRLDIETERDEVYLTLTEDAPLPFQRIRRITGYLTGDVRRWNDAKCAELKDRVKHGI